MKSGVIWLTGLSGAGKSTIADELVLQLFKQNIKAESLDGDRIRNAFPQTGFSKTDRVRHAEQVATWASDLEKMGHIVVVSLITPYEKSRKQARSVCQKFTEVYLSTPLAVCERRDPKGLYAQVRAGKIANFTGISDPYEIPVAPDLSIDTSLVSVREAVKMILEKALNR